MRHHHNKGNDVQQYFSLETDIVYKTKKTKKHKQINKRTKNTSTTAKKSLQKNNSNNNSDINHHRHGTKFCRPHRHRHHYTEHKDTSNVTAPHPHPHPQPPPTSTPAPNSPYSLWGRNYVSNIEFEGREEPFRKRRPYSHTHVSAVSFNPPHTGDELVRPNITRPTTAPALTRRKGQGGGGWGGGRRRDCL